jgi:hypothetical protein
MGALQEHYRRADFVLLSHSRGGLLTRRFLRDFTQLAERVRIVITLHSPHTGSSLASIAVFLRDRIEALRSVVGDVALVALGWLLDLADSDAYREMAVGSQFLTDLANGEQALPHIRYFTFGGISVRLTRIRSWVYTLSSAVPQWNWPPYEHKRSEIEVPGASPVADTLPNVIDELSNGLGDLLTADARGRLPFATHQTNAINHAEALWDPTLQAQVLRILGVDVTIPEPQEPTFWF